jgi:tubulin---tyrosine ligase
METSCPLLARIIPDVLDNTFRLVLDPIYPSPEGFNPRKTQQAPQEIKFTLVFDEEIDGPQLLKMRQAGATSGGNADEIESDNEEE